MTEVAALDGAAAQPAAPAKKRSPKETFAIPDGWIARGFTFEVTWPTASEAAIKVRSHFGARRFAYNWALAQVKADMDAKKANPSHKSAPWNLYALRKRFNAEKPVIAPWWGENSKEAYATGIADLCTALKNYSESRSAKRKGQKVGFPRFKSRHKYQARVHFSTGTIRVTDDRRNITLPVVGPPVSDGALGAIRPQLTYKMAWRGTTLTVADRWFASSKIHHGCGCRLIEPKKLAVQLVCARTGELVHRDINAAHNLRDWPDNASCGSVGATAPMPSSPTESCGGLGSDAGSSGAGGGDVRPLQSQEAVPSEARTNPGNRRGTPRSGAA